MTKNISDVIETRVKDGCFFVDLNLLYELRSTGSSKKRLRVDGDFSRWIATGKVESRWTKSSAQVMRGKGEDASAARKLVKQEVLN